MTDPLGRYRTIDLNRPSLLLAHGWRTWLTLDHSNAHGDTIQVQEFCCTRGHLTRGAALVHGLNTQRNLVVAVDKFLDTLTRERERETSVELTTWDDFETGRAR